MYFIKIIGLTIFLTIFSIAKCIDGYELSSESRIAVEICKKGNTIVQIIDLNKEGKVKFLHNQVKVDKNLFELKYIDTMWNDFKNSEPKAVSIVNGTFFDGGKPYKVGDKRKLAYVLKDNNNLITTGYDTREPHLRRLRINGNRAAVDFYPDYSDDNYVLGGLDSNKDKHNWLPGVARTLIGTNEYGNKIYILSTEGMLVYSAKSILESFGAASDKIMMLDAGGSAQYRSNKYKIIGDDGNKGRPIPQAIGTIGGKGKNSYSHKITKNKGFYREPNKRYFKTNKNGEILAELVGPLSSSIDLDLYLYKWNGKKWEKVAKSISNSSHEYISYTAKKGEYYTYIIQSYKGKGNYKMYLDY